MNKLSFVSISGDWNRLRIDNRSKIGASSLSIDGLRLFMNAVYNTQEEWRVFPQEIDGDRIVNASGRNDDMVANQNHYEEELFLSIEDHLPPNMFVTEENNNYN